MNEQFSRTEALIGTDALKKIKRSRVLIFGIGGVGSYTAESLARAGVGHLTLVDPDTVAPSNINRQLYALVSTIGMKKTLSLILALTLALSAFTACSGGTENADSTAADDVQATQADAPVATDPNAEHTKVKFEIEIGGKDAGSFTMELYPEYAPITVANFISLVEDEFYNGLIFHRIAEGGYGPFVAQGGDPKGNGTGGSKPIKGEFIANGVNNTLSHTRGVVSMARRGDSYDSGSCQFFICYNDSYINALDGQYAAFGKVIEGIEVVDKIASVRTFANDKPLMDQKMKSIRIIEE